MIFPIRHLNITWMRHRLPSPDFDWSRHAVDLYDYTGPIPSIGQKIFLPTAAGPDEEGEPGDGLWLITEVDWDICDDLSGWEVNITARIPVESSSESLESDSVIAVGYTPGTKSHALNTLHCMIQEWEQGNGFNMQEAYRLIEEVRDNAGE